MKLIILLSTGPTKFDTYGPTIKIQNTPNNVNEDCLTSKSILENLKVNTPKIVTTPTILFHFQTLSQNSLQQVYKI